MLKRRRRIQKYIQALKHKKDKKHHSAELLKLEEEQEATEHKPHTQKTKEQERGYSIQQLRFDKSPPIEENTDDKPVWQDQDEELDMQSRNMFKKLQLPQNTNQQQYEERLRRFYNSKYGLHNWAVQGEGEHQQDLNDLLNHEEIYSHSLRKKETVNVEFIARTTEHHASIVTGLDWSGQVAASCGYDQKLKLWSLRADEANPQLRLKLEKDVYTEGYALSNCFFRNDDIILGTLRQNYIVIDSQKWKINKVSSSFLNIHPSFQHLRQNNEKNRLLLFSDNKISILDKNHSYQGGLVAGQPLEDAQFGKDNQVIAISKDCLFQWDVRTWRLVNNFRLYNAFTKLWTNGDTVAIGNKLGVVSLATINEEFKPYAEVASLVTHVTDLKSNKSGDLLVQCSKWKQNAVRLIDTQKGRVVSGWPAVNTKLGLPTTSSFSSTNQLCIANSHGFLSFFKIFDQ